MIAKLLSKYQSSIVPLRRMVRQRWALAKERCKLDIRKYAFSQRTINEWNRLPGECVHATSVNMFKNKIDNYFKRSGYV